MPDAESWGKYGFPDGLTFRSPYLPGVGLCKALNERLDAVELSRFTVPEYFTPYPGMSFTESLRSKIGYAAVNGFVNPDNIQSANNYYECFWGSEFFRTAADGEDMDELNNILRPEFSIKWAVWMYNAINLLRYVPTTKPINWPRFEYEDLNNTFNFKA